MQGANPDQYKLLCKKADHGFLITPKQEVNEQGLMFMSYKRLEYVNPHVDFTKPENVNWLTVTFPHDGTKKVYYKLPNGNYLICLSDKELLNK